MSREWKPGDVAVVTTRSGREYRAVCALAPGIDYFWHSIDGEGGNALTDPDVSARPLVVIDPEDREQVALLLSNYHSWRWTAAAAEASITGMQNALRSLVAEPEPEEPKGLGAVVRDGRGLFWISRKGFGYPWVVAGSDTPAEDATAAWAGLPRPITVLSEGYSGEGS